MANANRDLRGRHMLVIGQTNQAHSTPTLIFFDMTLTFFRPGTTVCTEKTSLSWKCIYFFWSARTPPIAYQRLFRMVFCAWSVSP